MFYKHGPNLKKELNLSDQADLPDFEGRFYPYRPAPVVLSMQGERTLKLMNFSLVPSWSKTPKVKFATHNARIETVLEKPTWKSVFGKKNCLIPMTEFYESITELGKPLAGNMVKFKQKDEQLFVAAGIFDEWLNPETGEITGSFTILTTEPPAFIAETGHDRCPIFLPQSAQADWLNFKGTGTEGIQLLKSNLANIDFQVAIDRQLKSGWEKR